MMEFDMAPLMAITEREWVDFGELIGCLSEDEMRINPAFSIFEHFDEFEKAAEREAEADPMSVDIVDHYME